MSLDERFLQAIIENPDDDAPRLVYADWLEERGDPRGEFIRVQCQLARLPDNDSARPAFVQREHDLLAAHEEQWVAPLRPLLFDQPLPTDEFCPPLMERAWQFRRGFVERVALRVSAFLERADEVFRLAPVRGVWFAFDQAEGEDVTGKDHAKLAGSPFLARLETLDLSGHTFDGDVAGTHALLTSPHLADLRHLYLRYGFGMDDCGFVERQTLELLCSGKYLRHLTRLDLSLNEYVSRDINVFVTTPGLPALRHLCLRGVFLGAEGTRTLATSASLGRLRELDLSCNDIGDAGAEALAAAPHLASLTRLVVSRGQWYYEAQDIMTEAGLSVLKQRFGEAVVFVD